MGPRNSFVRQRQAQQGGAQTLPLPGGGDEEVEEAKGIGFDELEGGMKGRGEGMGRGGKVGRRNHVNMRR